MPKISFLGFVYNGEAYLADAIESLLKQDEKDIEVIYVNDGSTDGTGDILEYYKRKDPRFKRHTLPSNKGISKAWNQGLLLVESPYIAVCSGDDVYFPERATTHLELHNRSDAPSITYGGYARTDSRLVPFTGKLADGSDAQKFIPAAYEKGCLDVKQTIPHGFMSLTTRLAQSVPMREDLKVGVDYTFLKDLESAGATFAHTDKILGAYRHHSKMVSVTRRREIDKSTTIAGGDAKKSYGL